MDFSIKACDWSKGGEGTFLSGKSDCVVVGVFEAQTLSGPAFAIDSAIGGAIARVVKAGDIDGKAGSTLFLPEVSGIGASRVLLVGLGKQDAFGQKAYGDAVKAAWRAIIGTKIAQATFTLAQLPVKERTGDWGVRTAILALRNETYRFTQMKSKPDVSQRALKRVVFSIDAADEKGAKLAARQAVALANGMDLTRDLGNLPGNVCTPTYLAATAKKLARDWKLKVEVLGQRQIETLKMGSFLSVTKGSVEPPQFIVLHYQGASAKAAPIVLVGKGITFDTGGISLKPGEGMDEMKYDMCGAGSVLGTIRAVAEMGLKLNVIGIIPTCENMPAGNATKPGDIVTTMAGLTVEVLNTDAEGRLILCDALTYAERFKPAAVVDIATLTGACIIALGHHNSGLFSKDDALAGELLDASREANDPAWRLPLDDEYQDQLKSNFADLANIGGRPAGSVTAACFLSRFTENYPWAHLDIAGTAWKSGAAKGATGRPVPLLAQFLIDRAGQ
ncbi:leucyl aminopeptidase [Paraburkholderia silvatlantica]|uniref:Probable cytosol aminopeptidase n=1 Tax=Paraburkholderia silvatlantica TaxID=321895 RepID=A0A2U0ZTK9_9BURK|nr:leucyl aminopeptidase [Paraburkholderia silvatlantica]MBB2932554.1 leucyl aminopeptidase [Paraburkholderia silvatlantica]PVY22237.1 aminopeptidase A [Paraburkholderia silvatlantica]PXW27044.1 aminopeptidase A [Paraburkholderia silvatlantica]PYE16082.1 aminopeptidase A [Paraburkholderia silvatlantica]TDQ80338.1 aminopeptidase A [Paraburkholderia silvatlantica]